MIPPSISMIPSETVEVQVHAPLEEAQSQIVVRPEELTAEQLEALQQIFSEEQSPDSAAAAGFFAAWGGSMLMHEMVIQSVGNRDEGDEQNQLPKKDRQSTSDDN